ncbi:MAG: hypothetical protein HYU66_26920 [Armatimonadetes bacterium]|nr:hypothetical protein [Armatimonadota bacterium]
MRTLRLPLRAAVRVAMGGVLLILAACSAVSSDPAALVLTSLANIGRFEVAAGQRMVFTGDVTVQCQTAVIAGELYSPDASQPGGDAPGITIQAAGDIAVTGRIVTGRGSGSPTQGGDGGDIRLSSSGGSLTIGSAAARGRAVQPVLQTGDGGNGADGLLGGAGGDGGVIHLEAPNGVLTIHQRPGLIQVGNGGHGGRGVVGGQDLLTFTPPRQLANGGGDSGGINAAWGSTNGVEVIVNADATPPQAILLDAGVGTGGTGGDAGDFYLGVDPATGASTWPARARTWDRQVPSAVEVVGSDGGDGWRRAGNGTTVSMSYDGEDAPAGTGTSVTATGGKGGDVSVAFYEFFTNFELHAGEGGSAFVTGGNGARGSGCGSAGGDGGKATARGGDGGQCNPWVFEPRLWFPGKGGDATARGGDGGTGGSCCEPPGQAGRGGGGGDADARGGAGGSAFPWDPARQGAGGNAAAVGGDGGTGGDGSPPGSGGGGGEASAQPGSSERQPGTVTKRRDGASGGVGVDCTPPPTVKVEQEPNENRNTATPLENYMRGSGSVDKLDGDPWDMFIKTLAPGSYTVETTMISGSLGRVDVKANDSWQPPGSDPAQPINIVLPTEQDILIWFTQPQADHNEYTFEIIPH